MNAFAFPPAKMPGNSADLRAQVRDFLRGELPDQSPLERARSWNGVSPSFSRKLGQQGWLGMSWPRRYGGAERSVLERHVVMEELLAAGAPVAAHWFADRQCGPALLRYGSEAQRTSILPRIARGECFFCIGMSEPDVGSDLAAVRTRAVSVDGGYRITGTKLWTTIAHIADYMMLLCRTDLVAAERHAGLSQFVVDMRSPGIQVRPILFPDGQHHFNEVVLDDVFVPNDSLLGSRGNGWQQVMSELAHERSSPDRFLSSFTLLTELVRLVGERPSERAAAAIGRIATHLVILSRMSRSVAAALQDGRDPALQAVMVKDLGAILEQEIPEIARTLMDCEVGSTHDPQYAAVLVSTLLQAPSFSLRGGTREILRGIIARGLGLR
jgi:alkylation response protein AidB-like acyl-CoA dehydrogenase